MMYNLPQSAAITTQRLILREINAEVWDFIFNKLSDEEIMELLALKNAGALVLEKEKHLKGLTTYRLSFKTFLIIDKNSSQTIGKIGYHNWHFNMYRAEIGYGMDREEFKNKGYMKEAMKEVIKFGFNEMNLHRIEAFLNPANTPSRKLVEHFGFIKEGLLREHFLRDGVYEDSAVYSLLANEYETNQ